MSFRPRLATLILLIVAATPLACSNENARDGQSATVPPSSAGTTTGTRVTPIETFPTTSSSTTTATLPTLTVEQCTELSTILAEGPSAPIIPGQIDRDRRRQVLDELDRAIDDAPEAARPPMRILASAYAQALDELGNLQGDLNDPQSLDPDQIQRINDIMSAPDVQAATQTLESLTAPCETVGDG